MVRASPLVTNHRPVPRIPIVFVAGPRAIVMFRIAIPLVNHYPETFVINVSRAQGNCNSLLSLTSSEPECKTSHPRVVRKIETWSATLCCRRYEVLPALTGSAG